MSQETPQKGEAAGLFAAPLAWLQSTQAIQTIMSSGVNEDGSLRPEAIFALMKFCRIDASTLAREHGVSRQFVQSVINRRKRSSRIEDAIARGLRMPPEQVWGRGPEDVG